jgi:putative tryptophan/tyrosine transport system substrate-binding protein
LDLDIDSVDVREPGQLESALSIRKQPEALVLLVDQMIDNERVQIAAFAIEHHLPSISPYIDFAEAGGLMAYGVSLSDGYRRAVGFIDKILHGAKPANVPVEQPTKFDLVINLKTAKALGLTIPEAFLLRADEVIE